MQRTHFTAGYTLYNYVCEIIIIIFLQNRYLIMVKLLKYRKTDISVGL